jgi:hypothetical protein
MKKKNTQPPTCTGGYKHEIQKWRAQKEARKTTELLIPFNGLDEWSSNWLMLEITWTWWWFRMAISHGRRSSQEYNYDRHKERNDHSTSLKREKDILSSRLNNLEHCTLITFKASPWDWVGEKHSLVGLHVQEMCLLQAIYLRTCYGVFKEEAKQEMKTFIWEFLANPNPNLIQ